MSIATKAGPIIKSTRSTMSISVPYYGGESLSLKEKYATVHLEIFHGEKRFGITGQGGEWFKFNNRKIESVARTVAIAEAIRLAATTGADIILSESQEEYYKNFNSSKYFSVTGDNKNRFMAEAR